MKNAFDIRTEQAVLEDTVPGGFAAAVYERLAERGLSPLATAQILLETGIAGRHRGSGEVHALAGRDVRAVGRSRRPRPAGDPGDVGVGNRLGHV